MAVRKIVLVRQQQQLALDKLSWNSLDTQISDGNQTAVFEALITDLTGQPFLKLSRTYSVAADSYLAECKLTLENLSDSAQEVHFDVRGPMGIERESARTDMRKVIGGFVTPDGQMISSRSEIHGQFLGRKSGLKNATEAYERAVRSTNEAEISSAKENLRIGNDLATRYKDANFLWAATTNKYFAAIVTPQPDEGKAYCDWIADKIAWYYNPDGDQRANSGDETVGLDLQIAPVTLEAAGEPNASKTYTFQLYMGPKDRDLFYKNALYKKLGFIQAIDFMPCCCCPDSIIRPLAFGILAVMKVMYGFIGNYGIVIIILVFLMRLILHPVTRKSQVSMSKMGKLAPKTEEIKKKYANNKQEMNKQIMALYKEHGATPIMGMLPMFVQMPIWFALYSAVNASIDLRGAAFLPFWITDLSAPDALVQFSTVTIPLLGWKINSLNLLPILMGVAFYLQQKLTPTQPAASSNPQMAQQQKMMMIMTPLLFPLMFYNLPSGVNLYIMTSTFVGVIEQHVIKKHIRKKEEAETQGLVAVTSKTGGKVKKKKPKPFFRF
jgi:YidC/Oxa1 family membrane protein insertase